MVGSMLTVAPALLVAGPLKDNVRPAVSVNTAVPPNAPVVGFAGFLVATPATGVPGSTVTVTVWTPLLTPLFAVTVNVSVVVAVAACRWESFGV